MKKSDIVLCACVCRWKRVEHAFIHTSRHCLYACNKYTRMLMQSCGILYLYSNAYINLPVVVVIDTVAFRSPCLWHSTLTVWRRASMLVHNNGRKRHTYIRMCMEYNWIKPVSTATSSPLISHNIYSHTTSTDLTWYLPGARTLGSQEETGTTQRHAHTNTLTHRHTDTHTCTHTHTYTDDLYNVPENKDNERQQPLHTANRSGRPTGLDRCQCLG